ncbi:hypothetical protein BGP_0052 [Beggiatoa sp. PS]|nr:hypothetical protein BGP_0052 [Beggiatoa sp. PS]
MRLPSPLTNLQMELLELYSTQLSEQELNELKTLIAHFFANRAINEADRIWDEKNLSHQDMEKWLNE